MKEVSLYLAIQREMNFEDAVESYHPVKATCSYPRNAPELKLIETLMALARLLNPSNYFPVPRIWYRK